MFATWKHLLLTAAAVILVLLISAGVYVWFKVYPDRGDVPRLKTPAWEFTDIDGSQLMLRREYFDYQRLCWSADEKFVVYSSASLASLVVVETGL